MTSRPGAFLVLLALLAALPSCHKRRKGGGPPASILDTILFKTRAEVELGYSGSTDLAAPDLTGDGKADLLVAVAGSDRVLVLPGDGLGGFSLPAGQDMDVPGTPFSVAVADFNGDQWLDFAALRVTQARVSVFLNDRTGRFLLAGEVTTPDLPLGIVATDATGDGVQDLMVTVPETGKVEAFAGDGAGHFTAAFQLDVGKVHAPTGILAKDMNGDTRDDLVLALGYIAEVHVYLRLAAGGFDPNPTRLTVGQVPVAVHAADLDQDGITDLVCANLQSQDVSWLAGTGGGAFRPAVQLPVDGPPTSVSSGDLNGDGLADLLVTVFDHAAVSVIPSQGGGRWGAERQFTTSGLPLRGIVADVNGDGIQDAITTGTTATQMSLLFGTGRGGLFASESFATGRHTPWFNVCADFDGDGHADVAVSDRDDRMVSILRGDASGRITGASLFPVGDRAGNLVRADYNGDRRMDLAVAVEGGVRFLVNQSSRGMFQFQVYPDPSAPAIPAGVGPFEIATADVDGDLIPDLLAADYGGNGVAVLKGKGGGFQFQDSFARVPVPGAPLGLVVGNFDLDANADFAVARFNDARVTIFHGDGAGGFTAREDFTVGAQPNYMRAADFNGDRKLDLVVSNLGANVVTLILSSGGSFTVEEIGAGVGPTAILAADMNRDGIPDILVTSFTSADLRVLLGDGRGGFPNIARFPGAFSAVSADLGDIDGDGLPDLSVASLLTTRVTVFQNLSH